MKDSLLMRDSTEGDGKAEIVMDYVMSYSLRHAEDKFLVDKPMLCRYCRYMLSSLLEIPINDNTNIVSVKVWKEWRNIDLCVEVVIKDEIEHTYALLIENKYYSKLQDNQLERYKQIYDAYYDKHGVPEENRRYKLISCLENKEQVKKRYGLKTKKIPTKKKQEFTARPFYDLLPNKYWHEDKQEYEETESEIFNEFWLRNW